MTLPTTGNPLYDLLIAAFIGLIIGWLLTWLPMRSRGKKLEARVAELESGLSASSKDLTAARNEVKTLQANLGAAESSLRSANDKATGLQTDLQALADEKAASEVELAARSEELANARSQMAKFQENFERAKGAVAFEVADLSGKLGASADQIASLQGENAGLKANLEATQGELGALKSDFEVMNQALVNKDTALNEAYLRAVGLQRELADRSRMLASAETELDTMKRELSRITGQKDELEGRLLRARADVAGEMAQLTSTMVKMKDEELSQANARISALLSELAALKGGR